jgi:pimeloyl-ACP methyl ester carboxylesterase
MARRPARTPDAFAQRHLSTLRHIGSTTYPFDERAERAWALEAWARGRGLARAEGAARQIAAIRKSGDRTEEVRGITAPTLVVHGDRDRMVHPSGGEATAAAIPGARHEVVPGMRHHLAPGLVPRLLELILEHMSDADPSGPAGDPGQEDRAGG